MPSFSSLFVGLVLLAVAAVLVLGLGNFVSGGSSNRSQILMRWRVWLQFIAIVVIVAVLFMRGHG